MAANFVTIRGIILIAIFVAFAIIMLQATATRRSDALRMAETMNRINILNTSWQSYTSDSLQHRVTPETNTSRLTSSETLNWNSEGVMITADYIREKLIPRHIKSEWISDEDAWGYPLEFLFFEGTLAIRSPGRDGKFSKPPYVSCVFAPDDFDQDIVLWGGEFKRHPLPPLTEDWLLDDYMIRQAKKARAKLRRCD